MPRGGGAYLAEVDGNLTCALQGGIAELHWQGKFRGPDFAPLKFELRSVTHEQLKTSEGDPITTVVARALSDEAEAEIRKAALANEDALLQALANDSNTSVAQLATTLGWLSPRGDPRKSTVHRCLKSLRASGLIEQGRGAGYVVTKKGRALLEKTSDGATK